MRLIFMVELVLLLLLLLLLLLPSAALDMRRSAAAAAARAGRAKRFMTEGDVGGRKVTAREKQVRPSAAAKVKAGGAAAAEW